MTNPLSRMLGRWLPLVSFRGSQGYWRERYRLGGDSGAGSVGQTALYKAGVLNAFVAEKSITSVIEFGCGDGQQLALAKYPEYLGVDISDEAVRRCNERFAGNTGMRFMLLDEYCGQQAELSMSLDVIFHLVENAVYDEYLQRLFAAGRRYVVIYSTDEVGDRTLRHVRHRNVSVDVGKRFPGFARMPDHEAGLPAPVEYNRDLATRFMFYRRISGHASDKV